MFLFIVGTCYTFFNYTIFPEVNFISTVSIPLAEACDPFPYSDRRTLGNLIIRREHRDVNAHMNIGTCINPPRRGLNHGKYGRKITIPIISVASGHDVESMVGKPKRNRSR
jgi:hypothetical protein